MARALRPAPGGDPARPRPAPADLREDRRVRPLRPRRPRLLVGADRQGRRAPRGRGPRCDREPTVGDWCSRGPSFRWGQRWDLIGTSYASRGASRRGRASTKRPGGGFLADRLLAAVRPRTRNWPAAGSRRSQLDDSAGDEALVVEPVQELAVVLGEPHDRRARARLERPTAARARGSPPARTPGRPASRAGTAPGGRASRRSARPCRR